jgi:hypothetical protein
VGNLPRLLIVAVANYIIPLIPRVIASAYLMKKQIRFTPSASEIIFSPIESARIFLFQEFSPLIWYTIIMFFIAPILAYTHYLLYIPNLPFQPYARHTDRARLRHGVLVNDSAAQFVERISTRPDEPPLRPISDYREGKPDTISDKKGRPDIKPITDETKEPGDDSLRLNE